MKHSVLNRTTADCDYRSLPTVELRRRFLVEELFAAGEVRLVRTDLDRALVGSAVPLDTALEIPVTISGTREWGAINIGGAGTITVDGQDHVLERLDGIYIGSAARQVSVSSRDPRDPACFYLLAYPAHAAHATRKIRAAEALAVHLGSPEEANRRTLRRYIHPDGVDSCQLVMGVTELASGSVWNTFPPHTHDRRTEIYCYFDLPAEGMVVHLMGRPEETRHLMVRDRQAVLSPSWSCHTGVGTGAYKFIWGMGGENKVFSDMDPIDRHTFA
jgi:4-deoxy-L-threo-5-hexosulose-uronate ketol-isomerase